MIQLCLKGMKKSQNGNIDMIQESAFWKIATTLHGVTDTMDQP